LSAKTEVVFLCFECKNRQNTDKSMKNGSANLGLGVDLNYKYFIEEYKCSWYIYFEYA